MHWKTILAKELLIYDMKTLNTRQNESGLRKMMTIVKSDAENRGSRPYGGLIRGPKEIWIRKLIDDCCYYLLNGDLLDSALLELADALKELYESDYCAIGKVDEEFVEDCVVSWKGREGDNKHRITLRDLKNTRRVKLDTSKCCVCKALNSKDGNKEDDKELVKYIDDDEVLKNDEQFYTYKTDLKGIRNTTIIRIRNRDNNDKGYIQFINSKQKMVYFPFCDPLLRLILLIHRRDELKDAKLFKNDFEFCAEAQKKLDNIDSLLGEIMQYFSKEFSAGIVSFRIPLLVGTDKEPLFFLRDCYISDEIAPFYNKNDYFRDRLFRTKEQMGGYEELLRKNNDSIITGKAKDSDYYNSITNENICFRDDTLIIPIKRDYYYQAKKEVVLSNEIANKSLRLAKYLGIFKLRILKTPDSSSFEGTSEWLSDETKRRLTNLAEHISTLLNAFIKQHENKSLDIFHEKLKGTSFSKIKEFDEQCSAIIKESIHSKICVIYRFNASDDELRCNASTLSPEIISKNDALANSKEAIEYYRDIFSIPHHDKLVDVLFERKESVYFISKSHLGLNSIMIVPMIGKNNSRLGVVLLVGKEDDFNMGNLSKTFCEHDKKHIEFIMDMLNRIEESDSERLTFLSQLSHELLRPVTEMVYRNNYHISTADRDHNILTKRTLINELKKNVEMCKMFKYIIDDAEYIYSLSKGDVQYNFEMVDFKGVILDAIRYCEEEAAASKQLTIRTHLKNIPEKMYIDEPRMKQVVIYNVPQN